MARYEHLPIYKKALELAIYFEKIVRHFSRYHKYPLGSELRLNLGASKEPFIGLKKRLKEFYEHSNSIPLMMLASIIGLHWEEYTSKQSGELHGPFKIDVEYFVLVISYLSQENK